MKRKLHFLALLLILFSAFIPVLPAAAQDYYFQVLQKTVHVYWQADGSMALDYQLKFANTIGGHAIEYVDVGMPNGNYDIYSVTADVDGRAVSDISTSNYEGTGTGFGVGLGSYAIQPAKSGTVHIHIGRIDKVLFTDKDDSNYASAVFTPFWFGYDYVTGSTQTTVVFHLPPGVSPEEPRWHAAPEGFSPQPATGFDSEGRITYAWTNPTATGYGEYKFGASFPKAYVPADAIQQENVFTWLNNVNWEAGFPILCVGFFVLVSVVGTISSANKRKQYLPPAIRIEGNGIKRGLTAIEAAVLLEEPLDKVMTMILFAVVKKGAAVVTSRTPLSVDRVAPRPEGLRAYEIEFIDAITQQDPRGREKALRKNMLSLINATTTAMKGFSRRETMDYYRNIMEKAWQQVEDANTPEVKSEKFDEVMEWTMLDRNYDDRTKRVFRDTPVFIPRWWGAFDPVYRPYTTSRPVNMPATPTISSGGLPHLPGSDFAASIVNQVQGFSSGVVTNMQNFTSSITNTTNPPPPPPPPSSRSSGGSSSGGRSCACACACAGCACACAGGGR